MHASFTIISISFLFSCHLHAQKRCDYWERGKLQRNRWHRNTSSNSPFWTTFSHIYNNRSTLACKEQSNLCLIPYVLFNNFVIFCLENDFLVTRTIFITFLRIENQIKRNGRYSDLLFKDYLMIPFISLAQSTNRSFFYFTCTISKIVAISSPHRFKWNILRISWNIRLCNIVAIAGIGKRCSEC